MQKYVFEPGVIYPQQPQPEIGVHKVLKVMAFGTAGTGNAGCISWINPLSQEIMAHINFHFTTSGTGTFDCGVSNDGTGASSVILIGGTLTGAYAPEGVRQAGTTGGKGWFTVAARGVAGDSIVAKAGAPESTAAGTAVILYYTR